MSLLDPEETVDTTVARAINEAFARAYPGCEPTLEPKTLVKRVRMLVDDLICTRVNFHVTNKAYVDLDCKMRGVRRHWWQFWRKA